ncbi:MAG: pyridoxamine 5'-phosphate oxidase family protein [Planctomycetes bacterium]|nr:pyridoxamine 5'-phosphate oxidase family protein [Planctomycetota bacterium]
MRRKDKEIANHEEIDEMLSSALVGRLGTCFNDSPYITPVNFVFDRGKIFLHSAPQGRKITNIRSNPKVCFEIDCVKVIIPRQPPCATSTEYQSIIIFGEIRFVTDREEKVIVLNKLLGKYAPQPEEVSFTTGILQRTAILEISIEEITAKQSYA